MKEKIKQIIFNIGLPLLLGSLVGLATRNDVRYIETLNRKIMLPGIVFPIVWSILYVLMGIWAYFYSRDHDDDKEMMVYYVSLFVNYLFSFLLFTFHLNKVALIDTIVLLIMIIYLFIKTLLKKKKYAYLLLPYITWLLLATTLMIDIVIHN